MAKPATLDGYTDEHTLDCERVLVTHGYTEVLSRWLRENGWQAQALQTRFTSEVEEEGEVLAPTEEP